MRIELNNTAYELPVEEMTTLDKVLPEINAQMPDKHIIVKVILNGTLLQQDWATNPETIYLLPQDSLAVETVSGPEMAARSLADAAKSLQLVIKGFLEIANKFRLETEEEANSQFVQGIENLQLLVRILHDATTLLQVDIAEASKEQPELLEALTQLPDLLAKIIEAQQSKDWVYLADLIEYDLVPALENLLKLYLLLVGE